VDKVKLLGRIYVHFEFFYLESELFSISEYVRKCLIVVPFLIHCLVKAACPV
jgi:hypothetical protein